MKIQTSMNRFLNFMLSMTLRSDEYGNVTSFTLVPSDIKSTVYIYDIRFTFLFSIALSAVTFACIPTYQNDLLRYAVILVLVIGLFASKDKLLGLVKTMRKQ